MKRILVPTACPSDWQRLLAKPKLHWKKGASAMTTAAAWEGANGKLPPEISLAFGTSNHAALKDLHLILAAPEWSVALEGGETTSQTDVLALARNDYGLCVVAVEAKVNEPFGPALSEKRLSPSTGQMQRLDYLHDVLGVARFDDRIRYQLLHRTVSAVLTAREFHADTAVMLVQSFGGADLQRGDFDSFCDAMGAERLSPNVSIVPSFTKPRLFLAWCAGDSKFQQFDLPSLF